MPTIVHVLLAQLPADLAGAGPSAAPFAADIVTIVGYVRYLAFAVLLIATIGAGGMMAIGARRGDGAAHVARLGWVMAGAIVVASATGIVDAFV